MAANGRRAAFIAKSQAELNAGGSTILAMMRASSALMAPRHETKGRPAESLRIFSLSPLAIVR
jgi:hypothetical protein